MRKLQFGKTVAEEFKKSVNDACRKGVNKVTTSFPLENIFHNKSTAR